MSRNMTRQPTGRLLYPEWQRPYLAAMLEVESHKLRDKITDAQEAIHLRMTSGAATSEERYAILAALNALKFFDRLVPVAGYR
jgi:hypothetical protein